MKVITKSSCSCVLFIGLLQFGLISLGSAAEKNIKKRQIYREQVLPHAGGKIPETAFQTDRLALNRLQKEGISIPDGVLWEQRSPQVHQYQSKATRQVYRVAATPDGRYTPVEGRYTYNDIPSVETTYLVPQISKHRLLYGPRKPFRPIYRPIVFPSPTITDNLKNSNSYGFNDHKDNDLYVLTYNTKPSYHYQTFPSYTTNFDRHYLPPATSSYSSNQLSTANYLPHLNYLPTTTTSSTDHLPNYTWSQFQNHLSSHIFHEFDSLFNRINFRTARNNGKQTNNFVNLKNC